MKIPSFTIQQLLEAGVHLGHKTLRWNPKMKKYIFGKRDSIHIIDLTQTLELINTALESPLGQVSMIPLLAWIAKNAPAHLKATFFAVFASFTNLALSASALGTKYLNEIFTVTREVKDKVSGEIQTTADYSELGILLIFVTLLTLILPIIFVFIINNSKYKTTE